MLIYLYPLWLTLSSKIKSLAAENWPCCISKALCLIFVLSHRNRFINSWKNKPFNSFLMWMGKWRTWLLSFDAVMAMLLFNSLIVVIDDLLPAEGLIIIHRRFKIIWSIELRKKLTVIECLLFFVNKIW